MGCGFTVEKLYSDVAGSPFDQETTEIAVVAKKLSKSHKHSLKPCTPTGMSQRSIPASDGKRSVYE